MNKGYQMNPFIFKKAVMGAYVCAAVCAVFVGGVLDSVAQAQTLPAGTYTVTVTGPDGIPVATGSLIVNASGASQTVCPAGTTGTFPSCVPIGIGGVGASTPSSAALAPGDRVLTVVNANVRNAASITGAVLGVQAIGSLGTMNDVVPVVVGAHTWISVNFDFGADGWTAMANVQRVSSGNSGLPGQASACPSGTAGTYPNCVTPTENTGGVASAATPCPLGTTGTYPNCVPFGAPTAQNSQTGSLQIAPGYRMQTTDTLNVRSTPTTAGSLVGVQPTGATGSISSGPVNADGYAWFYINFDTGVDGWAVGTYMQAISTPPPAANINATCPAGMTGTAPNCVQPTATPATQMPFTLNQRVRYVADFNTTLFAYPRLSGQASGGVAPGALGTVKGGPAISQGHASYYVHFDSGSSGWIALEYLAPSNTVAPASVASASTYPQYTPNSTTPIISNVSQTTGTGISAGPVGGYYRFYCAVNALLLSYQPYWPVYGGAGGIYSTDSDICASAIQAGIMAPGTVGDFIVRLVPWQSISGTTANGITSQGTAVPGPAYEFASLRRGEASPARITNVTPLSGMSPLSTTFTVSNIPIGQMNAYTLSAFGPDGRVDSGYSIGAYVLDQVNQAFVTEGTKTLTFRTPGTYTIKLMQTVVSGTSASQVTLDTKTVTVTAPPPAVAVTYQPAQPLYANFAFTWLEPGTYTLDDGAGTANSQTSLGYVSGGNVSTARTYAAPGTYIVRLLKDGIAVVTQSITLPQ